MLKKLALALVALVAVFALFVATRPAAFHIERSRAIAARPDAVFAQVNDFHGWAAWSPWEHLDPKMEKTFSGPPSGAGADYRWKGNDQVGEGRMTILSSDPAKSVAIRLEFIKPFAAVSQTTFTFAPAEAGTKVTWAMDGENGFAGKAFSLFMNMDKQVGGDFERGLAALETAALRTAATPPK